MVTWACSACTYQNSDISSRCDMCLAYRTKAITPPPSKKYNRSTSGSLHHLKSPLMIDLTSASSMESARSRKRKKQSETTDTPRKIKKNYGERRNKRSPTSSSDTKNEELSRVRTKKKDMMGNLSTITKMRIKKDVMEEKMITQQKGKSQSTLLGEIVSANRKKRHSEESLAASKKNKKSKQRERDGDKVVSMVQQQSHYYDSSKNNICNQSRAHSPSIFRPLDIAMNSNSSNINNKYETKDNSSRTHSRSPPFQKPCTTSTTTSPITTNFRKTLDYDTLWNTSQQILKTTFKLSSLRNQQPYAVSGALKGQNQIIIMATGGGKSLCYQLPGVVLPGLTLVITPLIALMIDQVQSLNAKGINAAMLSSVNGEKENRGVLQRLLISGKATQGDSNGSCNAMSDGRSIKFLYVTPELIDASQRFRSILLELSAKDELALFAVDEAHCLSTWGHDFRPSYRRLSWLREQFPGVPCMACTATATPRVIQDIRESLLLTGRDVPCHMGSFNRANICYEVRYKDTLDAMKQGGAVGDLIDFIKQQHELSKKNGEPCSGIIYVHKRSDTDKLAGQIAKATGIKAAAYHAGLRDTERAETQQKWTDGTIEVAVATVAFGMGIDLAHVRYVLHWAMAKTVEGFYQESGRAGRDGKAAISILYYSKDDASKFAFLIKKNLESKQKKNNEAGGIQKDNVDKNQTLEALQKMIGYCTKACCRRQYLLNHFGEKIKPEEVCKKSCDYCRDPSKVEQAIEGSKVMKHAVSSRRNMRLHDTAKNKGSSAAQKWDGQWGGPHDSDNEYGSDGGFDEWGDTIDGLGITKGSHEILSSETTSREARSGGFVKASSILAKYEKMECQTGKPNGFVKFKAKTTQSNSFSQPRSRSLKEKLLYGTDDDDSKKRVTAIETPLPTPEHLRNNLPDPLASYSQSKTTETDKLSKEQSSEDVASELKELKAKLAKLKEAKAAKQADAMSQNNKSNMQSNKKVVHVPSSSMSFRSGKGRKRK